MTELYQSFYDWGIEITFKYDHFSANCDDLDHFLSLFKVGKYPFVTPNNSTGVIVNIDLDAYQYSSHRANQKESFFEITKVRYANSIYQNVFNEPMAHAFIEGKIKCNLYKSADTTVVHPLIANFRMPFYSTLRPYKKP